MRWMRGSSLLVLWAVLTLSLAGCLNSGKKNGDDNGVKASKCGMTIKLNPGASDSCGVMVPHGNVAVSLSLDDRNVRWRNTTKDPQTVHFEPDEWIFEQPYDDIMVPAKGQSEWYTIKAETQVGEPHKYEVSPLLDKCPPQEPAITADP